VIAALCAGGILAAVVAPAGSSSSEVPAAAAPPGWVRSIVSMEVRACGDPAVESALWVQTDAAAADTRLGGRQPGEQRRPAYLVVVTADTEFVDDKGFSPGGQPSRGKRIALLIDAKTHLVDTFGIGNDAVDMDGLGHVFSYAVG